MTKKTPMNFKKSRFASIDFETANYSRDSACALSIVVVENTETIEKKSYLIRPPDKDFIFTYLHGISWEDVAEEPEFGELWPDIRRLLEETDFLAAHNAPFDKGVLNACCRMAGVDEIVKPFLCTVKLARSVWNIYPTKLDNVCTNLGIPLNHHNAESDSSACAQIVISAIKKGADVGNFIK